jgi:dsRNA-specific ribonuclease
LAFVADFWNTKFLTLKINFYMEKQHFNKTTKTAMTLTACLAAVPLDGDGQTLHEGG